MKILCINTAFSEAQIVLKTENGVFEKILDANAKASENVMPAIDEILTENNTLISEIDVIGVVKGPGSFTGVRIGVALTKGFVAVNANTKICGVNSLDLMAFQYVVDKNPTESFCVVQNALGGRFFAKDFDKSGQALSDDQLVSILPDNRKIGLKCEFLGECEEKIEIKPQMLLRFVEKQIKKEQFEDVLTLAPIYIRLSQAEESLLNKENDNA